MNDDKDDNKDRSGSSATVGTALTASSSAVSGEQLAAHAKDALSHVADQAKELVGSQLGAQQKRSAGDLTKVAEALRGTSQDLGDSLASPLVDRAAHELERASKFLERATMSDVVDGVESFAKREPLLFLGGAFAIGLLGARFFKSSARRSQELENRMTPSRGTPAFHPMTTRPVAPPMRTSAAIARQKGDKRLDPTLPLGAPNGSHQGRMP